MLFGTGKIGRGLSYPENSLKIIKQQIWLQIGHFSFLLKEILTNVFHQTVHILQDIT